MSAYTQHTLSLAPPREVTCPKEIMYGARLLSAAANQNSKLWQQGHGGQVIEIPHAGQSRRPRRHMRAFANPTMLPQAEGSSESDLASWRPQLAFYLRAGQKVALRQHATILADRVAVGADLLLLRYELGLAGNPID